MSGALRDRQFLTLAPEPAAVRKARRFVAAQCKDHDVGSEATDVAVLLTSELVTNAVTHGRSDARLAVTVTPRAVLVEVGDDNSRHPRLQNLDRDALDGRGLRILDGLATRWGVREESLGKVVWFEVAT
jgi:anti-sigma regulatory factor (Ser/Thr protein kinase)